MPYGILSATNSFRTVNITLLCTLVIFWIAGASMRTNAQGIRGATGEPGQAEAVQRLKEELAMRVSFPCIASPRDRASVAADLDFLARLTDERDKAIEYSKRSFALKLIDRKKHDKAFLENFRLLLWADYHIAADFEIYQVFVVQKTLVVFPSGDYDDHVLTRIEKQGRRDLATIPSAVKLIHAHYPVPATRTPSWTSWLGSFAW